MNRVSLLACVIFLQASSAFVPSTALAIKGGPSSHFEPADICRTGFQGLNVPSTNPQEVMTLAKMRGDTVTVSHNMQFFEGQVLAVDADQVTISQMGSVYQVKIDRYFYIHAVHPSAGEASRVEAIYRALSPEQQKMFRVIVAAAASGQRIVVQKVETLPGNHAEHLSEFTFRGRVRGFGVTSGFYYSSGQVYRPTLGFDLEPDSVTQNEKVWTSDKSGGKLPIQRMMLTDRDLTAIVTLP